MYKMCCEKKLNLLKLKKKKLAVIEINNYIIK